MTGAALPNLGAHRTFAQLPDYDAETDQYNTANRHYSPSGRWMSPDPGGLKVVKLDDPQTWNLYAYVRNNPTTQTDPTGLGQQEVHGETLATPAVTNCNMGSSSPCDSGTVVRKPTTEQIRTELSSLASAYGVPASVVLAVARTESNFDVNAKNDNKNSKGAVTSTDYGLMQVNSKNIGKTVTGSDGKSFTITDSIKTDWKANANAGVAIVAQEYTAAVKGQSNGTAESWAQQTYSGYNAGPGARSRYAQTGPFGGFADERDRNFLNNYRLETTP